MPDPEFLYTKGGLLTYHGLKTGRRQGTNGRRAESSVAWMYLEAGDIYVIRWLGSPNNVRRLSNIGQARQVLLNCPGVTRLTKAWDAEVDERHLLPQRVRPQR